MNCLTLFYVPLIFSFQFLVSNSDCYFFFLGAAFFGAGFFAADFLAEDFAFASTFGASSASGFTFVGFTTFWEVQGR